MKIVQHLRRDAARAAGLSLVAGLAAAGGVAHAEGASSTVSSTAPSLSQAIFAPTPASTSTGAAPLLSPQVRAEMQRELAAPSVSPVSFVPAAPARAAAVGARTAFVAHSGAGVDFGFPLPGHAVNSRFGLRQLSFEPHARMHDGVDIAAPVGSQIHATAAGVVSRTGVSSSYGRFVEINHGDGVTSFYAHMSRTAGLRPGARVAEGEVLGYVGSTGHSTGPHLHFEIRKDGEPLNPQMFMGRQFASLGDLPIGEARAPGLINEIRHPLHTFASWRVRAHARGHVRHVARTLRVADGRRSHVVNG
jgi:murein DD-endopeptidase MepM/ murein hydrolase activator NlpD